MMTRPRLALLGLLISGCQCAAAQLRDCSFSATNINFGDYTGTTIQMTGTLQVSCPLLTLYTVGLNAGTSSGATITSRRMSAGSDILRYNLFSDAAFTSNWGDTAAAGAVIGVGTGSPQTLTVYGQVPARQFPLPGRGVLYSDRITATLSTLSFRPESANLRISANVPDACLISATDLAFGNYSGSLVNAVSVILVNCTNRTTYNVGLSAGTALGATVTNRSMTGPGLNRLNYRLLSNPARSINWGNTVGIDTVAGTGNGTAQSLIVYGQLPASQRALQPGTYSDMITATITF